MPHQHKHADGDAKAYISEEIMSTAVQESLKNHTSLEISKTWHTTAELT